MMPRFQFTMYPAKVLSGMFAGLLSVFVSDLLPLFVTVTVFEAVDFCTGVAKSAVVARRGGERFAFESIKAWRTIYKYVFILVGIVLCEMLDHVIMEEGRLRFANYFTAFCCGVEFWSFLENAAVISDHPIFRWLRKFMKLRVEDQVGIDFDGMMEDGSPTDTPTDNNDKNNNHEEGKN